ncbi:YdbH domain-containing protein [Marinibaculum pumilum]|uniref:YdbH domain-containing protein n=1 Tax=Marinibaculum pumilum TaxID=1766165 RepID=A0ABV7L9A1_9PROT
MRWLWIIPAALCGLLLVAATAFWFARLPLANGLLAAALDRAGIAGAAEVVRLDWDGAALRDVDLGGHRAERIEIAYAPRDLVAAGRVDGIGIHGLRLSVDLTADHPLGPLPDRLAALFAGDPTAPPTAGLPALPALRLDDARIALQTARGALELALTGGIAAPDATGAQAVDLSLVSRPGDGAEGNRGLPPRLAGRLQGIYIPGDGNGTDLSLILSSGDSPAAEGLDLAAEAAIAGGDLSLSLDLSGGAPVAAGLAGLPAEMQPAAGRVGLDAAATVPAEPVLAGHTGRLPALLRAADARLEVAGLSLPGRLQGLDLQAAARLDPGRQDGRLLLLPARISVAVLDPAWLAGLGLPQPVAAALQSGGTIDIGSSGPAPVVLTPDPATGLAGGAMAAVLDIEAGLTAAAGGRLGARLQGQVRAPSDAPAAEAAASPPVTGRIGGQLTATDLDLPGLANVAAASLPFAAQLQAEGLAVDLQAPLSAEGLRLAPTLAATLVPAGWEEVVSRPFDLSAAGAQGRDAGLSATGGGWRLTLPPQLRLQSGATVLEAGLDGSIAFGADGQPAQMQVDIADAGLRALPTPAGEVRSLALSGSLQGAPRAMAGDFRLRADLDRLDTAGAAGSPALEAELSAGLAWDERALTLYLTAPGSLVASGLGAPDGPRVERAALTLADVSLAQTAAGLQLTADGSLAPLQADLDGDGRFDDLQAQAERMHLDLTLPGTGSPQGRVQLSGLQAALSGQGVALDGGAATVDLADGIASLDMTGGGLRSTAPAPLFPPLSITGQARLGAAEATWRARLRGLNGALEANLSGRQDLAQDRGTAQIRLEPLRFGAGGVQPGDLNESLAVLEQAGGSLSGQADLKLGAGIDGSARLRLSDIGFTVAGTIVEGLDLELALDRLMPPASPPGQAFSVDRIDAGVALQDLTGTLRLQPAAGGSELLVEQAQAAFLGGRLRLQDAVIDPMAARYDLALQLEEVDLERLLALADMEEVSGTGRISGTIPVTVADGTVVVRDGALDALAPGVVAFRSDAARRALASGGEQVDLLLQALEDFHYDVLRMTVDKPADGESRVFLKLEGSNPAVLDGHPFVLNISLTSNVAPLLAALSRGTEISSRLVQQLLGGLVAGAAR